MFSHSENVGCNKRKQKSKGNIWDMKGDNREGNREKKRGIEGEYDQCALYELWK
jgi:hypothetical protein